MSLADFISSLSDEKRTELRSSLDLTEGGLAGRSLFSTRSPEERALRALKSTTKVAMLDRVSSLTVEERAALREALG